MRYYYLGFTCGSAGKESACNAGDLDSIPALGRSPGEGKGYPLQYFGLENFMDCVSPWGCKELDMAERLSLPLTIIWVLQGGARVENMREGSVFGRWPPWVLWGNRPTEFCLVLLGCVSKMCTPFVPGTGKWPTPLRDLEGGVGIPRLGNGQAWCSLCQIHDA